MLGVRGAAWLGGITLVLAAAFFAKWSIDQGYFSPTIRIALMLMAGTGALVWAELQLRQGFQSTANSVSGAGVVTLYLAFYAGHSLYSLFPLNVTFAGMTLVTGVAAAIAVRHAALFTAVLGLVGGLATPVLLSTGVDRPVAFFSYLVVLAVGFLYVAERRRWPAITMLALAGITMLELGWFGTYLTPEKLVVGLVAFAALGAAFLWHALRVESATEPLPYHAGLAGAVLPLLFVAMIAADPRFASQWPWAIGALAVIGGALVRTGMRCSQPMLVGASAVATGVTLALHGVVYANFAPSMGSGWALVVSVVSIVAAYNCLPRLAARHKIDWLTEPRPLPGLIAFAAALGLYAFTWAIIEATPSTWAFLLLATALFWSLAERTRDGRWPGALTIGALLLGLLCAHWMGAVARPGTYLTHLAIPHLLAVSLAILAARRALGTGPMPPLEWWHRDHAAVLVATGVAWLGLFSCVDEPAMAAPAPLFALLGVDLALVLLAAMSSGWTALVPAAAAAAVAFSGAWHHNLTPAVALPAVVAYATIYGLFLILPFVAVRQLTPAWTTQPLPWLTSALIGPATFLLFYDAWTRLWGKAWVGVVPVLMAAASVSALYGVSRQFAPGADAAGAERRLNYLALFAAIALGFVATAIPVQLDRQWVTIGWALEAAAVCWLFGLLPHPGLKYFGLALFAAVSARLLLNPEVLRYEPRGAPILNWLLYTYGVPAVACLVGAAWLRHAEDRRGPDPTDDWIARDRDVPVACVAFLGLLMLFWLINLEIADYYSAGRFVELDLTRHLQRDLTRSFAWGLYALTLLVVGLWRGQRGLRLVSLGFLMLTVGKVFIYDLGQLTGLYRIMSFMALGASLILVSLLYQRFVKRAEAAA